MLKLQSIEITQPPAYLAVAGKPLTFGCKVTLQLGDQSYAKLPIELSDADAAEVVDLILAKASAALVIVRGEPEPVEIPIEAPETFPMPQLAPSADLEVL